MTLLYLDASAVVKLAVAERESTALRSFLRSHRDLRASSIVARVEVPRALAAHGANGRRGARRALRSLAILTLDPAIAEVAAGLTGPVRSLDAIHVATAMSLGDRLRAVVTYDRRMQTAATAEGLAVEEPA